MTAMSDFAARWREWSVRFAALQSREKHLIVGALAVGLLFGGYSFWIEPPLLQKARLQKTLAQQVGEQEQLQAQIAALKSQLVDPDVKNRDSLQQLKQRMRDAEHGIRSYDRVLVPPRQAPALLQTLLSRHRGLALVSLTTLSPQPLIQPSEQKANKDKPNEAVPQQVPGDNIYKHGIEIKLSGSYLDLLAYVAELENSPQKLLWGRISFDASKHPVTEMTLVVYSLSLESTWLVV